MKKKYVKPDLVYENFELAQHVATCAWDMSNLTDGEICTAENELGTILFGTYDMCDVTNQDEQYCYTNGVSGGNVFNS